MQSGNQCFKFYFRQVGLKDLSVLLPQDYASGVAADDTANETIAHLNLEIAQLKAREAVLMELLAKKI